MIGFDTNCLLRLILLDDRVQSRAVAAAVDSAAADGESIYVSVPVICETAWVLMNRYGLRSTAVKSAFRELLEARLFVFAERDALMRALEEWRDSNGLVDLFIGEINAAAGCRTTLTFDKRASAGSRFTLL